jgi:hypothetical protein
LDAEKQEPKMSYNFRIFEGPCDRERFAPYPHDIVSIHTTTNLYQAAVYKDASGKPLDEVIDDLIDYTQNYLCEDPVTSIWSYDLNFDIRF